MVSAADPQAAPGALEDVRTLLNTWLVPNDSRVATDRFDVYCRQLALPPPEGSDLRLLRDDLRRTIEGDPSADEVLTRWVRRLEIQVVVAGGTVQFRPPAPVGPARRTLAVVLEAIAAGNWPRLKACPDCRWVFYDHTRSATKRWCLMNAPGPHGRGCGNIAKARRYRARQR